jgi:hypothetical protein
MATNELDPRGGPDSGWALGGIIFAAAIMLLIGIYQILAGLAAIINDDFFVVSDDYIYDLDATGWGWIHLIVGIIVVAGGVGLFYRRVWAGALAITLAILSAVVNFFFIPYYPFWSILIIALNVFVIWAITRPGALEEV